VPKILHTTVHTTVGFGYPLGVQTRHYILDELGNPKPEPDLLTHARWWAANEHRARVAESQVGPARISTVFLKSDWNFSFKGGPAFWETMVFGGRMDMECVRCGGTLEQAEAMHERMAAAVMEAEGVAVR